MNVLFDHERGTVRVVLSRRNLLTLLAKLDGHPPDSACTIYMHLDRGMLVVQAEEDAAHYADREPPGAMHPATEGEL